MKNLIAGNWKMNPVSQKEAKEIFDAIREGVRGLKSEVVICPPFVCLYASSFGQGIVSMGAQNCFWEERGAFTGEISPAMLKDLGIGFVIIGHSERRKYFSETDEMINKKIKAAINSEIEQIFCIGETEEERNNNKQEEVVERQIKEGLKDVSDVAGMVIAYEPVWAIGTGKACSVEDAKKMKEFIEKIILDLYGKDMASKVRILYGGSVNSQNSAEYIKEGRFNGLLVGGASLKPEEFVSIVKSAE
jgi:triosephosphate isomerase